MRTTTGECIRLVMVRNAQTDKNKEETMGNFEYPNSPLLKTKLTPNGINMAKSLENVIEYLGEKRHPIPIEKEPKRTYSIVIDLSDLKYVLTARPLINNSGYDNCKVHEVDDVSAFVDNLQVTPDAIHAYIIFTSANIIQQITGSIIGSDIQFGPALCSTTIIDIKLSPEQSVNAEYFIHELGGLGCLQFGGYDTRNIRMWNNNK